MSTLLHILRDLFSDAYLLLPTPNPLPTYANAQVPRPPVHVSKVKFKFASKCQIDIDYAFKVFIQKPRMGFCQYFTNAFEGNTHSAKLLTINNDPSILNISLQELDNAMWINTTKKWNNSNTSIYTTDKWIIMASSAERRDKGKAPAQGSS